MDKIKLGLDRLTDEEKVALIADHIAKMTGNAHFPTPVPPVPDFASSTADYVAKVALIKQLEVQRTAAINARVELSLEADKALTARAAYVEAASGGDGSIILTSGFALAKPHGNVQPSFALPDTPAGLALTRGDHVGVLNAIWHSKKGITWIVQVCPDPLTEANFRQIAVTSHSTFDLTGLTSGHNYWVRVAAVKSGVQGDWCQPLMCMAP